ncbi:MAG: hypothetical protein FWD05_02920 [Oscillospiraceae bacterium]|nr:hypothetical protein [Oscillospiraceae bacterium]
MKKALFIVFLCVVMVIAFAVPALTAPSEVPYSGTQPNELRALLSEGDVRLETRGNLGIFERHGTFLIPEGRTLTVATTLNIESRARLEIAGTLVILEGARLNNQGGSGGTIRVLPGGELINYGWVENVTNSTFINCGTIVNNGSRFELRPGTTFVDCGNVTGSRPINNRGVIAECEYCDIDVPPLDRKFVIDESGVIFDENNNIVAPPGVNEFMYVRIVEGPRAHVMTAVRAGDGAQWEHTRIAQPEWLDIIIATIYEENYEVAATALPELHIDRTVPSFGSNLLRLPDRTRVVINIVIWDDETEVEDALVLEYYEDYEEYEDVDEYGEYEDVEDYEEDGYDNELNDDSE